MLANLLTGLVFLLYRNAGSPGSWGLVPADDTWNALVYARSFADTLTFSYNAGVPEAGMTSPLWVVLLGMLSWIAVPLDFPELAQVTGILLAAGVSAFVFLIVEGITGMRKAGVLAGLAIAFDPTFSFAKVAGSEAALFSVVSLGAVWALLRGRTTLASLFLALAALARPEGVLLVVVVALVVAARRIWEQEGPQRSSELVEPILSAEELQEMALLVIPSLLAAAAWAAYNWSVTGSLLPNAFYVRYQYAALYDMQNLTAIWDGYLQHTSYLNGIHMAASLGVMAMGAYYAVKRGGFYAALLVLVPALLVYAFSILMPLSGGEWDFSYRRYLDPVLPYMVILLFTGVAMVWQASARYVDSQQRLQPEWRVQLQATLTAVVVALALVPLLGVPARWLKLVPEYSWNVRNVAEVSIPIARWMDANLPPDATVAALDPGALRYFSERPLLDLTGLNNHEIIGKGVFETVSDMRVDYIVAFDDLYMRSWPYASEIASVETQNNTILRGARLVVYKSQWEPDVLPKDGVTNISLDSLRLIDSLDIGDTEDELSHDYEANPFGNILRRTYRTSADVTIGDDARVTPGYESFRVTAIPGKDLVIVKRYDAAMRGAVRVFVNGQQVGVWRFPPSEYRFGEDQFVIPASFISGDTMLLRFEHIPDPQGQTSLNSFYYWIFAPDSGNDGRS